ncbi:MAG: type III polyketide synthase [Anaerolineales bacterium]|nr:type III polyketide synthase [Anaerolineales bacterium]
MTGVIAAVDCGTNTIKLLIGELPRVDVRESRTVRLGQGVDTSGRLADEALGRAFAAIDDYAVRSGQPPDALLASITHLVIVSCTGFLAPGLDFVMAERLGLPSTIGRTVVGFMGCAASFNGLRTAQQIVAGQPHARVLMISTELCSLHLQPGTRRDDLVSNSIFADGSAAVIVGQPDDQPGDYLLLDSFHTDMKPNTQDQMTWQIRDHGFVLSLSPRIPDHLADVAPLVLRAVTHEWPEFWAIHPGGRSIVDGIQEVFALSDEDVAATRAVLRDYGNMSSATILFVLAETWRRLATAARSATGVAMAFGPGLTVEMARLSYVPSAVPRPSLNGRAATTPLHA